MDVCSKYKCAVCGAEFAKSYDLISHIEAHHIDFNIDHRRLGKYLNDGGNINLPIKGLPMSMVLPCGDQKIEKLAKCDDLQLGENLQKHLRTVSSMRQVNIDKGMCFEEELIKCPVANCWKKYKSVDALKYHVTASHKVHCWYCGWESRNVGALQDHLDNVHNHKE